MSGRVMRECSVACPKESASISSCRSIATHAPLICRSARGSPHTVATTGSAKGVMRDCGWKRSSIGTDSRGRSVRSTPPPANESRIDLARSFSAASASDTSTGRRERLAIGTERAMAWLRPTEPRWSCCCEGSASSRRRSQPSPETSTLCM